MGNWSFDTHNTVMSMVNLLDRHGAAACTFISVDVLLCYKTCTQTSSVSLQTNPTNTFIDGCQGKKLVTFSSRRKMLLLGSGRLSGID